MEPPPDGEPPPVSARRKVSVKYTTTPVITQCMHVTVFTVCVYCRAWVCVTCGLVIPCHQICRQSVGAILHLKRQLAEDFMSVIDDEDDANTRQVADIHVNAKVQH